MTCAPDLLTTSCEACGIRPLPGVPHRPVIDCTTPHRDRLVTVRTGTTPRLVTCGQLLKSRTLWHAPKGLNRDVYDDPEGLLLTEPTWAHLVGSRISGREHQHLPVIDVDQWDDDTMAALLAALGDVPPTDVWALPSATPGHAHVYVQQVLGELEFAEVLMRLAVTGVVEPGYALAAIRRTQAHVRPPWYPKGIAVPPLPSPSIGTEDAF